MPVKITRNHRSDYDRYSFDFGCCSAEHGWAQVDSDQDAAYYGVWAQPTELKMFSFAEGDLCLKEAETREEFVAEMRAFAAFEIEQGRQAPRIDPGLRPEIHDAFVALGLGDMLHESADASA
jgi:hypothetical protein